MSRYVKVLLDGLTIGASVCMKDEVVKDPPDIILEMAKDPKNTKVKVASEREARKAAYVVDAVTTTREAQKEDPTDLTVKDKDGVNHKVKDDDISDDDEKPKKKKKSKASKKKVVKKKKVIKKKKKKRSDDE